MPQNAQARQRPVDPIVYDTPPRMDDARVPPEESWQTIGLDYSAAVDPVDDHRSGSILLALCFLAFTGVVLFPFLRFIVSPSGLIAGGTAGVLFMFWLTWDDPALGYEEKVLRILAPLFTAAALAVIVSFVFSYHLLAIVFGAAAFFTQRALAGHLFEHYYRWLYTSQSFTGAERDAREPFQLQMHTDLFLLTLVLFFGLPLILGSAMGFIATLGVVYALSPREAITPARMRLGKRIISRFVHYGRPGDMLRPGHFIPERSWKERWGLLFAVVGVFYLFLNAVMVANASDFHTFVLRVWYNTGGSRFVTLLSLGLLPFSLSVPLLSVYAGSLAFLERAEGRRQEVEQDPTRVPFDHAAENVASSPHVATSADGEEVWIADHIILGESDDL